MFASPFGESIVKRAVDDELVKINLHDLRDWTSDNHKTVDDNPFGGGPGMVMMVEPIYKALGEIRMTEVNSRTVLTSARGEHFSQPSAQSYSKLDQLIIITGRYEGVDNRVALHLVDDVVSIGDYVLTGGELPAMVIADATIRLLPGALGNDESLASESHNQPGMIEAPQYTRPAEFLTSEGEMWTVPNVLLSGDHEQIKKWRIKQQQS